MLRFFMLLVIINFTVAQPYKFKASGEIKGKVVDSLTNKPIPFGTVYIFKKDSLLNGSLTDKNGWFEIKKLPYGKLLLKAEFLGYKPYKKTIMLTPKNSSLLLGEIKLSPKDINLKEVEITGEKNLVETKIDRIVYNAEKDVTSEGGDATDVLRKVPYLSVDADGNVSLRGNSNVRIFINGKPSLIFKSNPGDALQALPAEQIQKVEVITVPSAKYEGEGSAGIVNIVLKQNKIKGKAGSFSIGGGNIYGSANANLGIKTEKTSIQTSLGGRYRYRGDGYTKFYMKQENEEVFQDGSFFPRRGGGRASFSIEHELKPNQTIQADVSLHTFTFTRENNVQIWGTNIPQYSRYSNNPSSSWASEVNLNYQIEFQKSKLTLASALQRSYVYEKYTLEQVAPTQELNLTTNNNNFAKSNRIDFQADYEKDLTDKIKLETGTKLIRRNFTSDFEYENYSGNLSPMLLSNNFDFNQDIYAGYLQLTAEKNKFSLTSGLRYEYTANKAISDSITNTQNYDNWFPNITLGYKLKPMMMLKLSYTNRIQRPFIRRLNPFVNYADPRSLNKGNPNLLPEQTHIIEFGLPPFLTFFWNYTNNIISNYTIAIDSITTLTYPINAAKSYSYGVSSFFMKKFFKKKLSAFTTFNIFYKTLFYNNTTNSGLQYFATINLQYAIKERFRLEGMAFMMAPRITIQGQTPAFNMFVIAARYFLNKKKTFSIAVRVTNPHLKYYEFVYIVDTPELYTKQINGAYFRQIGINIKYSFGNFKFKNKNRRAETQPEMF